MLNYFRRSLSIRLIAIFLVLGGLFVFGTMKAIQRFYNSDDIRGLISGHLSLHVQYVREDIGTPPSIDRAIAITERVPVDIRIQGPSLDWASNPDFPRLETLEFAPRMLSYAVRFLRCGNGFGQKAVLHCSRFRSESPTSGLKATRNLVLTR